MLVGGQCGPRRQYLGLLLFLLPPGTSYNTLLHPSQLITLPALPDAFPSPVAATANAVSVKADLVNDLDATLKNVAQQGARLTDDVKAGRVEVGVAVDSIYK